MEANLFDLPAGQQAAQAGIDQAEDHAQQEWLEWAAAAVRTCAETGEPFTTDQVYAVMEARAIAENRPTPATHERRAMGAVVRKAVQDGLIVDTGRIQPTERPEGHASPKRLWVGAQADDGLPPPFELAIEELIVKDGKISLSVDTSPEHIAHMVATLVDGLQTVLDAAEGPNFLVMDLKRAGDMAPWSVVVTRPHFHISADDLLPLVKPC